uniref:WD repeat containing protein 59 n=1 Tax=Echinococcus granulosus TaxID=6210 RepID=A0A068WPC6_ECHGR|nr:WD repeat containing protein 59 [Echinococcus granulosus]
MQPNILATASNEQFRSITVWDLRDPVKLVKNIELFSSTSLLRWDPFREHSFASGGDFMVQFWDLRSNTPERHLSMQSSRVLSMAWSPIRTGEFVLSTKDGSLRVWHLNNFDDPLLVGNYKKIPMFQLRYTPKGVGIVSLPHRTRWTNSGLILWRSDTLSPMRLVPAMNEADEGAGVSYQSSSGISEESCVLGFGWCRSELPPISTFNEPTFDLENKENLRDMVQLPNLVSWSRDRQLRVHNLPAAFLHVSGVRPSSYHSPSRPVASEPAAKDSKAALSTVDGNDVSSRRPFSEQTASQSTKTDPLAFQFVAQELSLLSSSIGLYRIDDVDRNEVDCTVRLTLYYCRRNHYHHRTVCGFDAGNEAAKSRDRADSLPLTDLDALFQSTTVANSPRPTPLTVTSSGRTLGSLPSAGNVTLLARFPPAYPAPNCPPTFAFIASDPVVHESTLMRMLKDIQHTAEKTVSASRGCLEPCIRKVFKHLTSTNLAFSSDEECKTGDNGTNLASSDPYVSFAQENPDFQASTTAEGTDAVSQPPSQDVFVPFPRTSGVRISPSGLMVAFGLHQPLVEIVQAASPVPLASTRTPRSFHDYLQLTEGKEHLFCKAADRQQRLLQTGDQAVGDTCSQLKRSLSADAVCAGVVRETIPGTSSSSLMTHGSPKNANRRRHFSGKTSGESRKVSTASTGKAPVVGTEQPTIVNQRTQMRRTSYATRFTPFHASNSLRKASFDRTRSNGSPRAVVSELSSLIPMSKYLATNYSLDIADPKRMCLQNLKVAQTTGRLDLIQFWSFVASLAGAKLRQPPFPPIVPPYASQSIGRAFFNTWLSHFLSLGDVQSLTMMGFAMAAIDAQSSPPALLLTAPSQVAAVALKQPQRTSFTYFRPCPLEQQKSPLRRAFQQVHQSATGIQASRRSKSTAMLPNLALLEAHEPLTLTSMERADEQSQSATLFIKRASLKPTTGDSTPTRTSHQATTVKSDKSLTDQSTYENGTSVPSYARTRSSSCSVNPLPSTESITTDPSESPQPSTSGTAPCYKVSVTTDIAGSEVFRSRQSSEEIANIALLQQHFREQVLMDIGGVTGEEPQQDAPYTSHVWLLSFKHVLQYTHFLNVYISLLSAWDLIMPRANFSAQWHKVLTWLHARSRPDFYHLGLAKPLDRQSQVLLSPGEWRSEHMPPALTHLLSLPSVQTEMVGPTGLAEFTATPAAKTATASAGGSLMRCAVCNITARGVIVACPLCHHGGHMEHMSAWCMRQRDNSTKVVCPAPNCDCHCWYLKLPSEPATDN